MSSEDSKPHSDLEIVRHYLNGHKRIVDGPDGSFTSETPPSVKPALAALERLGEQLEGAQHGLAMRTAQADSLEEQLEAARKALVDAVDVAIWLSGLPCLNPDSEAWDYWEHGARPKLYKAMERLDSNPANVPLAEGTSSDLGSGSASTGRSTGSSPAGASSPAKRLDFETEHTPSDMDWPKDTPNVL